MLLERQQQQQQKRVKLQMEFFQCCGVQELINYLCLISQYVPKRLVVSFLFIYL